jgi:hypothetical protein
MLIVQIFFVQAGSNAIGANDSNFFGNNAGDYAANAYASNFFGAKLVLAQQLLIIQISLVSSWSRCNNCK